MTGTVTYAASAKEDRERRARGLLDRGYHPARVAEMTGMSLGAVDRMAGTTPEGALEPMRRAAPSGPQAVRTPGSGGR